MRFSIKVLVVIAFLFLLAQSASATCDFTSAQDVTNDFCSWLNNHPNPSDSEITDKNSYYVSQYFDCSDSAVKDKLSQYTSDLSDLKNDKTTVSELSSQYCGACDFTSAEDVTNDFCSWLNNHPNPSDSEITDKNSYYVSQYFDCSDSAVKDKLSQYTSDLSDLKNDKTTVSELSSQYCGGGQPAVSFQITGVQAVTATAGAIAIAGLALYYVRYLR